jgi:hypothetical protein
LAKLTLLSAQVSVARLIVKCWQSKACAPSYRARAISAFRVSQRL